MSHVTPAGWYPDNQGTMRYWDGALWTEHTRPPTAGAIAPAADKRDGALTRLRKVASDRSAEKRDAQEAQERAWARVVDAAGALVTSGTFGTSTVEIYEGGYVRVGTGRLERPNAGSLRGTQTPYETLRSITFTESDADRTATNAPGLESVIGPAVAGLLKGSKHLMKTSVPGLAAAGIAHVASQGARTCYLTIVTDRQIHTLSNQTENDFGLKTAQKGHTNVGRALAAAGDGVIQHIDSSSVQAGVPQPAMDRGLAVAPQASAPSIADRLRELAALHQEGVLSDDEFASAKATLLGGL